MVIVKFFATLRDITDRREIHVDGARNVEQLLKYLYEKFGDRFREEIKGRSMILVNGKNIMDLNGLKTEIRDDDIISIFPPAGGG